MLKRFSALLVARSSLASEELIIQPALTSPANLSAVPPWHAVRRTDVVRFAPWKHHQHHQCHQYHQYHQCHSENGTWDTEHGTRMDKPAVGGGKVNHRPWCYAEVRGCRQLRRSAWGAATFRSNRTLPADFDFGSLIFCCYNVWSGVVLLGSLFFLGVYIVFLSDHS